MHCFALYVFLLFTLLLYAEDFPLGINEVYLPLLTMMMTDFWAYLSSPESFSYHNVLMSAQYWRPASQTQAVLVHIQALTAVGFLATGTYQRDLADRSARSHPNFSSSMPSVLGGVTKLAWRYIVFPYTLGEQANVKTKCCDFSFL